jgi:undecaprenyl-phosphate 4-deoxy-4-formamido-L-arabinose transferase
MSNTGQHQDALSVVVPVYNSEMILPVLVSRLEPVLRARARRFELILVNDGSRDNSWQVICDLASRYTWICGVNLMRNYGQHNALLCGIRLAQHPILITMDDDLQHPPEEIPKLLEALGSGQDVVYGTPAMERHGLWRDAASRITKLALQGAMGADTARRVSAFRVLRTGVRDAFRDFRGPFVSIDTLLTWGTCRFAAVPVRSDPRYAGASNYTLRKLIIHAFNMMTGFSTIPLQFASWIGFAFTVVGICILTYVIGRYLMHGGSVPGFPFLASIIAVFAGAQLFALGIIGEYLARMHFRIMDKPSYVVRSHAEQSQAARTLEAEGCPRDTIREEI